tara:strand:+ start:99 stop:851 length:753 start_codon:yes stop_codon:yes gene_type:complete
MSFISIIIPYYQKKNYIEKTINSILNQTHENFEILIVDDEQSPESSQKLKELKNLDDRIRVISKLKNQGAGYSRNQGIKFAKGTYIAFCDADDLWVPKKLESQIKFMIAMNIDFSFTSYEIVDENQNIVGFRKATDTINFEKLIRSCDIGLSTVIIKKKIFDNLNIYFPNIKTKEDYVFWLFLSKNGVKMFGLDEKLSKWRKLSNSLSSSIMQKILDGYRVYRIYLKFSIIKSLYCLFILSINFLLKNKN